MLVEYFLVGYILKPQGLKGEIKVKSMAEYLERFNHFDSVFLIEDQEQYRAVKILSKRYSGGWVFLRLQGYDSREQIESIRGKSLWIPRSMARKLPENTYFIVDIVGCSVVTKDVTELGVVTRVIQTGSNDVYVVKNDIKEVLIPALKKVVLKIDIDSRQIVIDPSGIEELLYNEN